MNPSVFLGGKHHIDRDLLQLLYGDHPRLCASHLRVMMIFQILAFKIGKKVLNIHLPKSPRCNIISIPTKFEVKNTVVSSGNSRKTRPATDEEDTTRDIKVQKVKDQGDVRPATPSNAKGDKEEGVAVVLPFGGYNDEGEPVSKTGNVLEAGQDYVVEEYIEAHPLRRKGLPGGRWISPPFVATMTKMTNLLERDLLGIVKCFLPSLVEMATNPREECVERIQAKILSVLSGEQHDLVVNSCVYLSRLRASLVESQHHLGFLESSLPPMPDIPSSFEAVEPPMGEERVVTSITPTPESA
uniref:Uncharacterized protein n=1 Tax=Cannabis sativa TaxID=3483 RepID=A0A803P576_CANSA